MLRKPLFVMLRRTLKPEQAPAWIERHLRWVIAQEEAGHVFASGPFVAPGVVPGTPGSPEGGLTLLRASSMEAAREIAESDPYVSSGTVAYELKEWLLMEGGFQLRVRFSQGTFSIE
jgi:uncharacterized protein YciI